MVLLGIIPVAIRSIDPRQHFSDCVIELSRNLATYPAVLEHQSIQELVLMNRNLMLLSDFAIPLRIQTRTLSDNAGGFHRIAIIAESYRQAGWIRYKHIRFRNFN